MNRNDEIARLAREEHEEREERRSKKKKLRGHTKPEGIPRTLRAKASAEKAKRKDSEDAK